MDLLNSSGRILTHTGPLRFKNYLNSMSVLKYILAIQGKIYVLAHENELFEFNELNFTTYFYP